MAKTPLGWKVEVPGSRNLTAIAYNGHRFIVKKGAGGNISRAMLWLITELDKIETLTEPGWDGTWSFRPVRGGAVWSEHAAGTALDWNASQHPMGGGATAGFSDAQVSAIRKVLATPRGQVFRWGADYRNRKDAMHFEMVQSRWLLRRKLFAAKTVR